MRTPSIERTNSAANLPIERLAGNPHVSETEKIAEVSRQFEAVLLRQILGEAQKKVFASTTNPDSVASGVYRDMVTDQLAENISRSGALGLADSLNQQLQYRLKTSHALDGSPKV